MDDIPGEGCSEQDEDEVKYKRSGERCDPCRCECLSHTNVMTDLMWFRKCILWFFVDLRTPSRAARCLNDQRVRGTTTLEYTRPTTIGGWRPRSRCRVLSSGGSVSMVQEMGVEGGPGRRVELDWHWFRWAPAGRLSGGGIGHWRREALHVHQQLECTNCLEGLPWSPFVITALVLVKMPWINILLNLDIRSSDGSLIMTCKGLEYCLDYEAILCLYPLLLRNSQSTSLQNSDQGEHFTILTRKKITRGRQSPESVLLTMFYPLLQYLLLFIFLWPGNLTWTHVKLGIDVSPRYFICLIYSIRTTSIFSAWYIGSLPIIQNVMSQSGCVRYPW